MTKDERYQLIVERLKKEGRLPSLEEFVNAMVEGRYEYEKRIAAWNEFDQIGTTDTETDTNGLDAKTSDNEKSRKPQTIM
jgi:hypothetical protein